MKPFRNNASSFFAAFFLLLCLSFPAVHAQSEASETTDAAVVSDAAAESGTARQADAAADSDAAGKAEVLGPPLDPDSLLLELDDTQVRLIDLQAAMIELPPSIDPSIFSDEAILTILDNVLIARVLTGELSDEKRAEFLETLGEADSSLVADPGDDLFAQARQRVRQESDLSVYRLRKLEEEIDIEPLRAFAREQYLAVRSEFVEPEQVKARHIVLRTDEENPEAASAALEALRTQLLDDPSRFAELAKEHSEDPGSASRGGDLGWFSRGTMVEAFEQAAFSQTPGVVGEIVETPFGHHLILVEEKLAPRQLSLEEVEPQLVNIMVQERLGTLVQERVMGISGHPDLHVEVERIQEILAAWPRDLEYRP